MSTINLVKAWTDEVALGMQRVTESRRSLMQLARDTDAVDDVTRAIRDGGNWDDPFDAVRDLAVEGNRGLWDGWTKAEAAQSVLTRAVQKHPGGAGRTELVRAQAIAEQASGDLGNWIATSGRGATFESLESSVRRQLEDVRRLAEAVLRDGA